MAAAGQAAVNGVVEKITTGPFAPLAPYTLERRKAKGRTGEKPAPRAAERTVFVIESSSMCVVCPQLSQTRKMQSCAHPGWVLAR